VLELLGQILDFCTLALDLRRQQTVKAADSRGRKAESREQRAESREQRAESREQRAESREQRAESREQSRIQTADCSSLAVDLRQQK
jgi:hypothetical protein